ncbi:sulfotransferase [Shewanella sp. 10N.286.51.B7]|uniref:sulfotransferase n=1 Tax=Shewanella sp. 10N.286.51.B7 TaxID=1880836 RepID=UPI001F536669|nr:sulfotransferase [Shewanella sp. 10N.286.51.B7]
MLKNNNNHIAMHSFDRPIIILSAPRSGSTLLFEVLSKSEAIYTIGGESHALIETIPSLNIAYRNFSSNALYKQDLDDGLRQQLLQRFSDKLQDYRSNKPNKNDNAPIRLLEKTPKNSLRVEFLNELFPDALFIYLVRDPKDNISSIMQAWRSNKFVTYPNLPGWNNRNWSLLLPDDWQKLNEKPLHSIAAFQWLSANEAIMNSLQKVDSSRWCILSYEQLINEPEITISRLCKFTETEFDTSLAAVCREPLPYSRYTISAPSTNKWLENYHSIETIWPNITGTLNKVNRHLGAHGCPIFKTTWQKFDIQKPEVSSASTTGTSYNSVARNSPCPCGSGKRYKQCHGALN